MLAYVVIDQDYEDILNVEVCFDKLTAEHMGGAVYECEVTDTRHDLTQYTEHQLTLHLAFGKAEVYWANPRKVITTNAAPIGVATEVHKFPALSGGQSVTFTGANPAEVIAAARAFAPHVNPSLLQLT